MPSNHLESAHLLSSSSSGGCKLLLDLNGPHAARSPSGPGKGCCSFLDPGLGAEGALSLKGPGGRQEVLPWLSAILALFSALLPGPPRKGATEQGIPRERLPPPTCQTW